MPYEDSSVDHLHIHHHEHHHSGSSKHEPRSLDHPDKTSYHISGNSEYTKATFVYPTNSSSSGHKYGDTDDHAVVVEGRTKRLLTATHKDNNGEVPHQQD